MVYGPPSIFGVLIFIIWVFTPLVLEIRCSVNMKVFKLFTPFTLNVSVNGVNSENRVNIS